MMSEMTLGERIVLLALDESSGELREPPLRVALATAAATLFGLTLSGHVVADGERPAAAEVAAPEDPVAAALFEQLRDHPGGPARAWLLAVREQALSAAYEGLLSRGLVGTEGRKVLGAFGSVRHPVTDPGAPAALREALSAVLLGGEAPDRESAVLLTVLHHAGLGQVVLPGADPRTVAARLAEVAADHRLAAVLGDAAHSATSVVAAVIAASAATTAALTAVTAVTVL